ncbi:hypothetical protein Dimus_022244 [Dionaea muscipula]
MDIDFINIPSWVIHNNKGIEVSLTIIPSTVTSSTPHDLPSAQEPSAYEPPTQSNLDPPQLTVRLSDSSSVDSSHVDSSMSFRTTKLDSSPQTRISQETFSNPGFPLTILRLIKVANVDHEFKINVNLSMNSSDLV